MSFFPKTTILVLTLLITLGLAISLQGVLGINIGSVLNLMGNKITNVGAPTAAGDAATKGFVDSAVVAKALYGYCGYKHPLLASCFAKSPAFCDPTVDFGNNCKCPAGYEMLPTGSSLDAAWIYMSCYKL